MGEKCSWGTVPQTKAKCPNRLGKTANTPHDVWGEAMTTTVATTPWSGRNILIVSVVLSLVVGAAAGFAAASIGREALPAPQDRTIFLFTTVLGFNETKAGTAFGTEIPHDYFAPDRITVNRGDRVEIRYYNTEDEPEDHTFTMSYSSYSFDSVLQFQQVRSFNFTANTPGVFPFICKLHQPTMTGYLVVLEA